MEKRGVIDERTPSERTETDPGVKIATEQAARDREDHARTRLHDGAAAAFRSKTPTTK